MKILHTSDWHLGQIFYGYDRLEENRHFMSQVRQIAIDEHPDALLLSGDIFDVSTPSAACVKMFNEFLLDIHDVIPEMTIVVTSGNHDSASRIDVNRNLWKKAGIHVIGNVMRIDGKYDFSDNIVPIPGKGYVMAIPYINRSFMAPRDNNETQEKRFFDKAADSLKGIADMRLPVALMAHLAVEGSDMKGHRFAQTGNINLVDNDIFDKVFDYVALGHIHKAQNLDVTGRIRYSGSPMAMGFDEDYTHSVSLVEIEAGENPMIKEIQISPLREMRTVPVEAADFEKALKVLKKYPADDKSYIRLNVCQAKDLPSDCQERAAEAARDKDCKFCMIKVTRPDDEIKPEVIKSLTISEFVELMPRDIARRFFNEKGIDEDTSELYLSLLDGVSGNLKT